MRYKRKMVCTESRESFAHSEGIRSRKAWLSMLELDHHMDG